MKGNTGIKSALIIAALCIGTSAMARDDKTMHPIKGALETADAQGKLNPDIKLYFGSQSHPKGKELGEWKTNKKTNGFNKSDVEACNWAFLSAVLELQERAAKEGGFAVVNIKSNYKSQETSSETEFMCGSGALISGVALKGTVLKK